MSGPTEHRPLIFYVGDTILIDVQCTDAIGNVLPLQGVDAKWVMQDPSGNGVVIATIANGQIRVIDMDGGKIEISIPASQTITLAPGLYQDQLRLKTLADGYVITQMVGLINIKAALADANPMP
jgi:hypothetical protein